MGNDEEIDFLLARIRELEAGKPAGPNVSTSGMSIPVEGATVNVDDDGDTKYLDIDLDMGGGNACQIAYAAPGKTINIYVAKKGADLNDAALIWKFNPEGSY